MHFILKIMHVREDHSDPPVLGQECLYGTFSVILTIPNAVRSTTSLQRYSTAYYISLSNESALIFSFS